MDLQAYKSKIIESEDITSDVHRIKCEAPKDLMFKPGQFCMVKIGELEKSLSIACAPNQDGFLEFAKKNTGSEFSQKFFSLKPGDEVELTGSLGNFVLNENNEKAVFLSGGIGITPLRSMLQHAKNKKLATKIYFIYSNKTPSDIAFKEELDELNKEENIKVVNTITRPEEAKEWSGKTGRINEELIRESVPGFEKATYYICGPPKMVEALIKTLEEMNIPKEQITFENFTGY